MRFRKDLLGPAAVALSLATSFGAQAQTAPRAPASAAGQPNATDEHELSMRVIDAWANLPRDEAARMYWDCARVEVPREFFSGEAEPDDYIQAFLNKAAQEQNPEAVACVRNHVMPDVRAELRAEIADLAREGQSVTGNTAEAERSRRMIQQRSGKLQRQLSLANQ